MPSETTANQIVNRIVLEMTAVLKTRKKEFSRGALAEWRGELLTQVQVNLGRGGNWPAERAKVLRVAKDMARIAAIVSSSKPKVDKAQVHAAFRAVKDHVECPVASRSIGSGRWCDFDI